MTTPNRPRSDADADTSRSSASDSAPEEEESRHTFSVVAAAAEQTEHTFGGSVGTLRYGSVQAWYVRAVEGAPRLSAKGEQQLRERLRRTHYDMAVALGTSPAAVAALNAGFAAVHGGAARGYFLRWPTTEAGLASPADVRLRALGAQEALAQLSASTPEPEREKLLERSISTIFELRPSDAAVRGVLSALKGSSDPGVRQEHANIQGAVRSLQLCRNKIIDPHLRIVLRELRRHMSSGAERRELLQEGNVGLLKAAEVYDESREVPFSAYALTWVRSRMKRAILRHRSPLHLPDRMRREVTEVRRVARELSSALSREPTLDELAKATGHELEHVRRLLVRNAISTAFTSLHASSGSEDGGGLDELLSDPSEVSAADLLEERELLAWLEPVLETLDERQRQVLQLRFGLGGSTPHTLAEAGKLLGVSGERIRQIEAKALESLAKSLEP